MEIKGYTNNSLLHDLYEIQSNAVNLFKSMKPQFLTAAIIPVLIGTSLYYERGTDINWTNFMLALLGICFLHISANMFNDYFDNMNGTDRINTNFIRPFTGGSRSIQDGIMKPYQILFWALIFLLSGIITGLILLVKTGPVLLLIGLPGILSIIFYVNKNFSLVSKGLGELTIFLNFGPLPVLGAYYVQTKTLSFKAFLVSIPIGLLITAVLYINQFPDYSADKKTGKNNLVVRLGLEKAKWGYHILIVLTYISVFYLLTAKILPIQSTVIYLTLPLGILNSFLIARYPGNNSRLLPALPSTIIMHLLTGYFLTVTLCFNKGLEPYTYILLGLGLIILTVKTFALIKYSINLGK